MQALLLTASNLQRMNTDMNDEETKLLRALGRMLSDLREKRHIAVQSKSSEKIANLDEQVRELTATYMQVRSQMRRRRSVDDKQVKKKRRYTSTDSQPAKKIQLDQSLKSVKIECTGCQGPMTGLCITNCPYNCGMTYRALMGQYE